MVTHVNDGSLKGIADQGSIPCGSTAQTLAPLGRASRHEDSSGTAKGKQDTPGQELLTRGSSFGVEPF